MHSHASGSAEEPDGDWQKSSYSNAAGCCVETTVNELGIKVRDSKYRQDPLNDPSIEPVLSFTPSEWRAFIQGVKDGEFDHGVMLDR